MKTIIVSDIHVGAENCEAKQFLKFLNSLKKEKIDRLIINGDLIDNFDSKLPKTHWKILAKLSKLVNQIEICYIGGNHEQPCHDILAHLIGVEPLEEYIFDLPNGKKVLVVHGDYWDEFLSKYPLITNIADWFYRLLQRWDSSHNWARFAKKQSKTFLRCVEQVRVGAIQYCKEKGCNIVCSGHTHHPEVWLNDSSFINYYNSGSWCEKPCTFIEINDNEIQLKEFNED
jgi:UDP-2,3-diacylglucosamine pyrophosphatase LpxH